VLAARDPHLDPPPSRGRSDIDAGVLTACATFAVYASLPLKGGEIEWGVLALLQTQNSISDVEV
jgi:hypothetical protein